VIGKMVGMIERMVRQSFI